MNRNLFLFGFLLVLMGFGTGFYVISIFGFLLLIPSLLSPPRPPPRAPAPVSTQQPKRMPHPLAQPPAAAPSQQPAPAGAQALPSPSPATPSTQGYAAALFPTPMFPSLSMMGTTPPTPKEIPARKPDERDELVEVGAMLALMKLALG